MQILTTRITPYLLDLIDPHQIGFMACGLIEGNGFCARMIMDIA